MRQAHRDRSALARPGLHLACTCSRRVGQSTIFTDKKIEDYPKRAVAETPSLTTRSPSRVEDDLGRQPTGPTAGYFGPLLLSSGCRGAPIEFYGDPDHRVQPRGGLSQSICRR